MSKPFTNKQDVAEYLSHPLIQCLECGRWYQTLGAHLPRTHGMTAEEYKARWTLPAGTPLAGAAYREHHRQKLRDMQRDGRMEYSHLPKATRAAANKWRGQRVNWERSDQSERAKAVRPGDHNKLSTGSRRSDGRDADRAREYQQARRSALSGDNNPMTQYRKKYDSY